MFLELINTLMIVIPLGMIGIFLFSKLVDCGMDKMMSSQRLNHQLENE